MDFFAPCTPGSVEDRSAEQGQAAYLGSLPTAVLYVP